MSGEKKGRRRKTERKHESYRESVAFGEAPFAPRMASHNMNFKKENVRPGTQPHSVCLCALIGCMLLQLLRRKRDEKRSEGFGGNQQRDFSRLKLLRKPFEIPFKFCQWPIHEHYLQFKCFPEILRVNQKRNWKKSALWFENTTINVSSKHLWFYTTISLFLFNLRKLGNSICDNVSHVLLYK